MELVGLIRGGKVGLFPTDTVYGLGCIANSHASTTTLYRLKQRPLEKTLPILIGGWDAFERYAKGVKRAHRKRLESLWPGALTVVVPVSKEGVGLSYHCQFNNTIALRMPDHPQLRYVIEQTGVPLAATSANLSNQAEALSLEMVPQSLRSQVDWAWSEPIPLNHAVPSTVVDLTGASPVVLREGNIRF
jgi:L-threonylcarbamoyladenylate synthase